jgi:osmotically-inducible protein OsmY
VLRRGDDVFYNDGLVGSLDHMLIDPASGTVTHLVVEEHGTGRRVIVPAEWVRELQGEAIVLSHWNPYQPGVPAHEAPRDDAAISADLNARLRANPAFSGVQAQVDRGVARLSGNVSTIADKAAADAIARDTPSVIDVQNALSADTALFGQVTAALAADRRTALIPIEVIAERGVVTLKGEVPKPEIISIAEQIARSVPGVVAVINELEIRCEQPEPQPAPVFLAPQH